MCLSAMMLPIAQIAGTLFSGTGRAHWWSAVSGVVLAYQCAVIPPLASRFGVLGAAWADVGAAAVLTVGSLALSRFMFPNIAWNALRAGTLRTAAAMGCCAAALSWRTPAVPDAMNLALRLGCFAGLYAAGGLVVWRGLRRTDRTGRWFWGIAWL